MARVCPERDLMPRALALVLERVQQFAALAGATPESRLRVPPYERADEVLAPSPFAPHARRRPAEPWSPSGSTTSPSARAGPFHSDACAPRASSAQCEEWWPERKGWVRSARPPLRGTKRTWRFLPLGP